MIKIADPKDVLREEAGFGPPAILCGYVNSFLIKKEKIDDDSSLPLAISRQRSLLKSPLLL